MLIPIIMNTPYVQSLTRPSTVILAHGAFPTHAIPLLALQNATPVICCDGAAQDLINYGRQPDAVIGDCDSLPPALQQTLADRLIKVDEQDTNDLAKALRYATARHPGAITILGASGKREDHLLGNLAQFADFAQHHSTLTLLTDTGSFRYVADGTETTLPAYVGQPVSLFPLAPDTELRSQGLRYPLDNIRLTRWWQATLNTADSETITLRAQNGGALIYQRYPN